MQLSFSMHPASGALLVCVFLLAPSRVALAALAALALHEGAHLLAMCLCGVKRCTIELTPFGGVAGALDYEGLTPLRQGTVALAGVLGSGVAAALCLLLKPRSAFAEAFGKANLLFALLNALPVWPLDGARALAALARRLGVEQAAARVMLALSYGISLSLLGLGLYGAWLGRVNLSLLALGPYLAYAAYQSAIGSRIRSFGRAASPLPPGCALPVRAYACGCRPGTLLLSRLWKARSPRHFCVLHLVNEAGEIESTLSQEQIGEMLFNDAKE